MSDKGSDTKTRTIQKNLFVKPRITETISPDFRNVKIR